MCLAIHNALFFSDRIQYFSLPLVSSSWNIMCPRQISLSVSFFKFAELLNSLKCTSFDQVLPIAYFPPSALSWPNFSSASLFLTGPELCWPSILSPPPTEVKGGPLAPSPGLQLTTARLFLLDTPWSFPFACPAALPNILLISASLLLYPIKENIFSVRSWDITDFWDQLNLPIAIVLLIKTFPYVSPDLF